MTIIFHIDLNSFFASCEIAKNPSLKNKPIVVAGNSRRGIVTTASYEARKYGIHSAMPLFQATKLCKGLIILPVNMSLYKQISKQFFEIISMFSKKIEVASIDECYVDMSDVIFQYHDVINLATTIQQTVLKQLNIGCSIGISHNKFLAKMASDIKKPFGITLLTQKNIQKFLWPLPISEMYGIGKKTVPKLEQLGIYTIKDIANQNNFDQLKQVLGKNALIYFNRANGIDLGKINAKHNELKSIGNSTTLSNDTDDLEIIKETLKKLSLQVSKRAKQRDLVSSNISITIKYTRESSVTRSYRMEEATNEFEDIYSISLLLFERYYEEKPLRLLGVSLNNIIARSDYTKQLSLFSYQEEIQSSTQKENQTDQLIKQLNQSHIIEVTRASDLLKNKEVQSKYIKEE